MLRTLITTTLMLPLLASAGQARTIAFTEEFTIDAANWREGPSPFDPITHVAAGGVDGGGYVTDTKSFNDLDQGTLFRGHESFDASGGAFTGNWIDEGYVEVSAWVRHSAPMPLTAFARMSTRTGFPIFSDNFPAALGINFAPVLPNEWTEITFNVENGSPQLVSFEGSDYDTVYSDITNLQFGFSVPDGMEMDTRPFTFDLDRVSLAVPEPGSAVLVGLALGGLWLVANRSATHRRFAKRFATMES